jgi:hypothetical protein
MHEAREAKRARRTQQTLGRPLGRLLPSWKIHGFEKRSCPAFEPPRSHSIRRASRLHEGRDCDPNLLSTSATAI